MLIYTYLYSIFSVLSYYPAYANVKNTLPLLHLLKFLRTRALGELRLMAGGNPHERKEISLDICQLQRRAYVTEGSGVTTNVQSTRAGYVEEGIIQ